MSGMISGSRSGVEWRRDRRPVGWVNDGATSCTMCRMVSGAVQWVDEGLKEGWREERCGQRRCSVD